MIHPTYFSFTHCMFLVLVITPFQLLTQNLTYTSHCSWIKFRFLNSPNGPTIWFSQISQDLLFFSLPLETYVLAVEMLLLFKIQPILSHPQAFVKAVSLP